MRTIKGRRAGLVVAAALFAAVPAANVQASSPATPQAVAAKPCSSGWTHAALPWGHKCLRGGQYCKKGQNRLYRRYGYVCKRNGRLRSS